MVDIRAALQNPKTRYLLFGLAGLLIGLGIALYVLFRVQLPDAALERVYKRIPTIKTYVQENYTETSFPSRHLYISGLYLVDYPNDAYASFSTTTLVVDGKAHAFVHENVSIGGDVYVRIDTTDPLLIKSIKLVPQWAHFTASTIPANLVGVAIAGPIEDTLQILSDDGKYLRLVHHQNDHYRFVLSGMKAPGEGPLNALLTRIATGTVDVWIDDSQDSVREIVLSAPPFYATTTISRIDQPMSIEPPITE